MKKQPNCKCESLDWTYVIDWLHEPIQFGKRKIIRIDLYLIQGKTFVPLSMMVKAISDYHEQRKDKIFSIARKMRKKIKC